MPGVPPLAASLLGGRTPALLKCKWQWVRLLVKPPGAPGPVECAWALEAEGLSSRPDSALTGWATLDKPLNFFELQLLHLQNGDNKAIYFSICRGGAMSMGTVQAQCK